MRSEFKRLFDLSKLGMLMITFGFLLSGTSPPTTSILQQTARFFASSAALRLNR